LRKDYVCTPENIERAFCLLTVSSNIGDRIDSVQKSGDHSDRRDVISGERVAVISSYRINDKQKIRSRVPEFFFLWLVVKPVDTSLGRIRNRNEASTWCSKSAEEYSGSTVIRNFVLYSQIANSSRYRVWIHIFLWLIY